MFKYYWRTGLNSFYKLQRGAIMVFFAILLPLLFGFMGLSIDVGLAYVEHGKVQDIADSAALAGAAHLSDSNRDDAIKAAVKAYVEANGIALQDDDLLKKESNSWETKESVPSGRQAVVAYGVVTVNNSEGTPVDRVRVRITKRVPVVFMSIVDGIADTFTVSAKAAAEGGGEESVVISGGAEIMCAQLEQSYLDSNNIKLKGRKTLNVYSSSSGIDPFKLPGEGLIYANGLNNCNVYYDGNIKEVVYTPPLPNGRSFIPNNGYTTYPSQDWPDKAEAQLKAAAVINSAYANALERLESEGNSKILDVNSYINPSPDSNKRYIGPDKDGKMMSNIKDTDVEIDLFIDGVFYDRSYYSTAEMAKNCSVLTDTHIKNVKKVNNIISKKHLYIATNNVDYGNVYGIERPGTDENNKTAVFISGNNNDFSGTVYALGQMWIGGKNNEFLGGKNSNAEIGLICGQTMHLGRWTSVKEEMDTIYVEGTWTPGYFDENGNWVEGHGTPGGQVPAVKLVLENQDESWNNNFNVFFGNGGSSGSDNPGEGSGSGESGSSGEGSAATGKLRLVE